MHNQNFDLFQPLEAVDQEVAAPETVQGAAGQSESALASVEVARACDLLSLADVHERKHIDSRDIEQQALLAKEPHKWLPFKVLETDDGLALVDGAVLIQAICLVDPETLVPIIKVQRDEALKIRSENFAKRTRREPMAEARRALILRKTGYSYEQIRQELRILGGEAVSKGRISQLIKAAETEAQWGKLYSVISNPGEVSQRFWEALATKLDRLREKSANEEDSNQRSDLERFEQQIRDTLARLEEGGQKVAYLELANTLALANCGKGKSRNRQLGEVIAVPGTQYKIGFAPDRKGGAAITLPHMLAQEDVLRVRQAVMDALKTIAAERVQGPRTA
ncbi:MAG: hypothetical protein ACJLS3_00120 [Erythrobacter sp.]